MLNRMNKELNICTTRTQNMNNADWNFCRESLDKFIFFALIKG